MAAPSAPSTVRPDESFFDLPHLPDPVEPGTRDYAIMEWCDGKLKAAQRFIEAQPGYDKIELAIAGIFAEEGTSSNVSYAPMPRPLSRTRANLIAKTAEDVTALLTDTRVFFNYATYNQKYQIQAELSNKTAESWYSNRLIDLRIGDVVRYYTVAGTGYAHMYYSARINDIMVDAVDPRNVLPINPISYHTLQDAGGVIVRMARTPEWVKEEYGKTVAPDTGPSGIFGWFTRVINNVKNRVTGPLSPNRTNDPDSIPATPTVFVNMAYLEDKRSNKTSNVVLMGKWGKDEVTGKDTPLTNFSYEVKPGAPLYPFKRLIVWGGGQVLYDGPNPYWHGKYPIIKLTLNPWPMSFLGKAPLWDLLPLNASMNSLLQVVDDHAAQVAQPGVVADRNVSRAELNKFNSRLPGYQIRTNLAAGKGIQVQIPPPLDQSLWQHINWIETTMQKLSGTADVSQMANLAQIPSNDTIDTIMKAMTPGVRLRSRILEGFMKEFAEMYLWNLAQFDTLAKRIQRFGPSAVTPEDFDYSPGTFIPDDVPDGQPGDIASVAAGLAGGSPRPLRARAESMLLSFSYTFKAGSLLNSAAQQDRLEDLILSKMGYVSWFTVMERLGRMNLVPPSVTIPSSELERLQLQQQLGIGMVANAQGRKATDSAPPALQTGSGGDPTITTS